MPPAAAKTPVALACCGCRAARSRISRHQLCFRENQREGGGMVQWNDDVRGGSFVVVVVVMKIANSSPLRCTQKPATPLIFPSRLCRMSTDTCLPGDHCDRSNDRSVLKVRLFAAYISVLLALLALLFVKFVPHKACPSKAARLRSRKRRVTFEPESEMDSESETTTISRFHASHGFSCSRSRDRARRSKTWPHARSYIQERSLSLGDRPPRQTYRLLTMQ